tara:strand:- start:7920 stop:8759 length:840 start_codon:yes stop_codon:yes gene_type:complete
MKQLNQSLTLNDIHKFKRFKGIYRIVDMQIADLDFDFFVNLMICDGDSKVWVTIANNREKHCDYKVGAFVYIDCMKPPNFSGWRVYSCMLVTSKLALESQGFIFNQNKLETAEKCSIPDLFLEINSSDISSLVKKLKTKMFEQVKAGITFDIWLEYSVNRFLNNVVSVEFESNIERDYAITIGFIYAVFITCVGPSKRFDMTVKEDMTFLDVCQEIKEYLSEIDTELSAVFSTIILKTDPLTVEGSKLSSTRFICAIQIIACQAVECFGREMKNELEEA